MASDTDRERVWALIDKIGFCMLVTKQGSDLRARPMAAYAEPADNAIYFLTDVDSHKDDEIEAAPDVCLAFADAGDQNYLSVSGHAQVLNDRARISQLWSTPAKAWWDSPDDPSIRVLKVTPRDAQYWDSPGTVVSYVKMIAAALSDAKPAIGDHGEVRM